MSPGTSPAHKQRRCAHLVHACIGEEQSRILVRDHRRRHDIHVFKARLLHEKVHERSANLRARCLPTAHARMRHQLNSARKPQSAVDSHLRPILHGCLPIRCQQGEHNQARDRARHSSTNPNATRSAQRNETTATGKEPNRAKRQSHIARVRRMTPH